MAQNKANRMTFDYDEHTYTLVQGEEEDDIQAEMYRNGEYVGKVTGGDIFHFVVENNSHAMSRYMEQLDAEV